MATENDDFWQTITGWMKDWTERFRYTIVVTFVSITAFWNYPLVYESIFGEDRYTAFQAILSAVHYEWGWYFLSTIFWMYCGPWVNFGFEYLRIRYVQSKVKKLHDGVRDDFLTSVLDSEISSELKPILKELKEDKARLEEEKSMLTKALTDANQKVDGKDIAHVTKMIKMATFNTPAFFEELIAAHLKIRQAYINAIGPCEVEAIRKGIEPIMEYNAILRRSQNNYGNLPEIGFDFESAVIQGTGPDATFVRDPDKTMFKESFTRIFRDSLRILMGIGILDEELNRIHLATVAAQTNPFMP